MKNLKSTLNAVSSLVQYQNYVVDAKRLADAISIRISEQQALPEKERTIFYQQPKFYTKSSQSDRNASVYTDHVYLTRSLEMFLMKHWQDFMEWLWADSNQDIARLSKAAKKEMLLSLGVTDDEDEPTGKEASHD